MNTYFCTLHRDDNPALKGDQKTLKYILKLANETYYVTLKHEIDKLRKHNQFLENHIDSMSKTLISINSDRKVSDSKFQEIALVFNFTNSVGFFHSHSPLPEHNFVCTSSDTRFSLIHSKQSAIFSIKKLSFILNQSSRNPFKARENKNLT